MNKEISQVQPTRVLSIFINSLGFGFSVTDSPLEVLIAKQKQIRPVGDSRKTVAIVNDIIEKYKPITIVLEDFRSNMIRRSKRSISLQKKIILLAKKKGIIVRSYSREQIRLIFSRWNAVTRYEIAEVIARNVESLKPLLYEKPKPPFKDSWRTGIFTAVSLAITFYYFNE